MLKESVGDTDALAAVCRILDDGDRLSVTTASDRLGDDPSAMAENAVEAFCEGNDERQWTFTGGCGDDSDGPVPICEECYDEATSHVDTRDRGAHTVNPHTRVARRETAFVIAHRLSTVRNTDEILVLDDGEITERGTHRDLLVHDGLYANLWRMQADETEDFPREFIERPLQRGVVVEETGPM